MNDYYPRGLTMSQLRADEERITIGALYSTVIAELYPGCKWDDLWHDEQREVEAEVERRQRRV